MSRNQNRLLGENAQPQPEDTSSVPAFLASTAFGDPSQPQISQGLNFVTPTEFVALPSRGRYYPEGHPLQGVESVEMRYMTAKEEDILTSQNLIKRGVVLDRLVHSVVLDKRIDPDQLLVGDKAALLIAARVTGYGSAYNARVSCPSCFASQQHDFDLNDLPEHEGGTSATEADVVESSLGLGVFSIALEKTPAVRFHVKLLTGVDEKKIGAINERRKKHNLSEGLLMTQFEAIVVGVEFAGKIVTNKTEIQTVLQNLPASESRYLRTTYAKLTPTIALEQKFTCESCGEESSIDVPMTPDFFWPKNR